MTKFSPFTQIEKHLSIGMKGILRVRVQIKICLVGLILLEGSMLPLARNIKKNVPFRLQSNREEDFVYQFTTQHTVYQFTTPSTHTVHYMTLKRYFNQNTVLTHYNHSNHNFLMLCNRTCSYTLSSRHYIVLCSFLSTINPFTKSRKLC